MKLRRCDRYDRGGKNWRMAIEGAIATIVVARTGE
ncbi:MAG: hypothetical protein RLZZ511_3202 [Cyanobacteriota bacterium]|jgi:hypothetical protein